MTTKELIYAALEQVDEARLEEVYQIIKQFALPHSANPQPSLISKLKRIQIDAPPDFAAPLGCFPTNHCFTNLLITDNNTAPRCAATSTRNRDADFAIIRDAHDPFELGTVGGCAVAGTQKARA